jgi:hypothetical protein
MTTAIPGIDCTAFIAAIQQAITHIERPIIIHKAVSVMQQATVMGWYLSAMN